ncbi:MAG TPA: response regulator transcription factor [Marmoricola sp.]|nr:response regulator transcription factor [Marmoricola sp.]
MQSPAERPEPAIRVVIVHPLRAWAEALERLLQTHWDIDVVSAHTSLDWARNAILTGQADVLVAHLGSPASESFALFEELEQGAPGTRIVVISDADDPAVLGTAIRLGVRGWVEPASSMDHLVNVLHGVVRGETWMPPRLMAGVLESLLSTARAREQANELLAMLSTRETEILRCLAEGMTRQEIAAHFCLSPHTVRTHINNLLHKLDVHSTLAAVSLARRVGLVDLGGRGDGPDARG